MGRLELREKSKVVQGLGFEARDGVASGIDMHALLRTHRPQLVSIWSPNKRRYGGRTAVVSFGAWENKWRPPLALKLQCIFVVITHSHKPGAHRQSAMD